MVLLRKEHEVCVDKLTNMNNLYKLKNKYALVVKALCVSLVSVLCACTDRPAAYDFSSTPVEGWEPGDTLKFKVDTLNASGWYDFNIGVRTSSSTPYPYQTLWMVVHQHWHNPEQVMVDTVKLQLTDERGDAQGHGVTLYQVDQPWRKQQLVAGQWAEISIIHIMRREMLPGISDVGIRLQRE